VPTNIELIHENSSRIATLMERSDNIQRDIADRNEPRILEVANRAHGLEVRISVLEERIAELKKGTEEGDRKQWRVVVAGIAAVLSLIVNLVILFIKK